jgi:hypothetical protein
MHLVVVKLELVQQVLEQQPGLVRVLQQVQVLERLALEQLAQGEEFEQLVQQPNLKCQLIQVAHQLQQLYLLGHQLLEESRQLVMEFQYQLCQLKLREAPHLLQLNLLHS